MSRFEVRIRPADLDTNGDREAIDRLYREVGWLGSSVPKSHVAARDQFLRDSYSLFAELEGRPECCAASMPGSYSFHGHSLPLSAVMSVITSRVARKQGLASRATAALLRKAADDGAVISGLGMFDQGFYDKLGFGHGGYDHYVMFDPGLLNVPYCRTPPVRLSADDFSEMHQARLSRLNWHGAVTIHSPGTTHYAARRSDASFGLGFRDADGTLTHHLWIRPDSPGAGPYKVLWMAYSTLGQFVELLGLLRNLGDQVYLARVIEPSGIQLQDFLDRPFRRHAEAKGGRYETYSSAVANFQYRLLSVESAVAAVHFRDSLEFHLRLTDPIERYLPSEGWRGCAGDYALSLGETSSAKRLPEGESGLMALSCGIGDFTRLFTGVLPASTLLGLGRIECSSELAAQLDSVFARELPHTDWLY